MPGGRPPKLTASLKARIAELLWLAFTDDQIALIVGLSSKTIQRLRNGQFCPEVKKAELAREAEYRKRIWNDKIIPAGICWMLERKYPTQFAKPEIQLSFQNNYTLNQLHMTISSGEAKELEAAAQPVRESVKTMFEKYRPALGNGNGHDDNSA